LKVEGLMLTLHLRVLAIHACDEVAHSKGAAGRE